MVLNLAGRTFVAIAGFLWGVSRNFREPAYAVPAPAPGRGFEGLVTEARMAEALEDLEKRINREVGQAFTRQSLAIESLREMIRDTDVLLERVLSRLESHEDSGEDDSRHPTPIQSVRL